MPHSGGGGSHSGGSHSGSSSSSYGHSSSSNYTFRTSNNYFNGARKYVRYSSKGTPEILYSNEPNLDIPRKSKFTGATLGLSIPFILIGVVEYAVIIFLLLGIKINTPISMPYDNDVAIYDEYDMVSEKDEESLKEALEEFKKKTGVVPIVEFTVNSMLDGYGLTQSYAYDKYLEYCSDEKHFLLVYSYENSIVNEDFNEFYWETMWGDDTTKAIGYYGEQIMANKLEIAFMDANGKEVPVYMEDAIREATEELCNGITFTGCNLSQIPLFLFLLFHGGIFGIVGIFLLVNDVKLYKQSQSTYEINDEVISKNCEYCGNVYYPGTISKCINCGAPLDL